jgi:hypothetical protein
MWYNMWYNGVTVIFKGNVLWACKNRWTELNMWKLRGLSQNIWTYDNGILDHYTQLRSLHWWLKTPCHSVTPQTCKHLSPLLLASHQCWFFCDQFIYLCIVFIEGAYRLNIQIHIVSYLVHVISPPPTSHPIPSNESNQHVVLNEGQSFTRCQGHIFPYSVPVKWLFRFTYICGPYFVNG